MAFLGIYMDGCSFENDWNAYSCGNSVNYKMVSIESMDWDFETRRLSPVAIVAKNTIDLINGPQVNKHISIKADRNSPIHIYLTI